MDYKKFEAEVLGSMSAEKAMQRNEHGADVTYMPIKSNGKPVTDSDLYKSLFGEDPNPLFEDLPVQKQAAKEDEVINSTSSYADYLKQLESASRKSKPTTPWDDVPYTGPTPEPGKIGPKSAPLVGRHSTTSSAADKIRNLRNKILEGWAERAAIYRKLCRQDHAWLSIAGIKAVTDKLTNNTDTAAVSFVLDCNAISAPDWPADKDYMTGHSSAKLVRDVIAQIVANNAADIGLAKVDTALVIVRPDSSVLVFAHVTQGYISNQDWPAVSPVLTYQKARSPDEIAFVLNDVFVISGLFADKYRKVCDQAANALGLASVDQLQIYDFMGSGFSILVPFVCGPNVTQFNRLSAKAMQDYGIMLTFNYVGDIRVEEDENLALLPLAAQMRQRFFESFADKLLGCQITLRPHYHGVVSVVKGNQHGEYNQAIEVELLFSSDNPVPLRLSSIVAKLLSNDYQLTVKSVRLVDGKREVKEVVPNLIATRRSLSL
jgi:hypothetical protein